MKLPWDKNYLKISFHVVFTILIIYILGLVITNITSAYSVVIDFFSNFFVLLGPLLIALVIAYILSPVVDFLQNKTENAFKFQQALNNKKNNNKKNNKKKKNQENKEDENKEQENNDYKFRVRGTALAYILFFLILGIVIAVIVVKIGATNLDELVESINNSINGFSDLVAKFYIKLSEYGVLETSEGSIEKIVQSMTSFFTDSFVNIAYYITTAGNFLLNTVLGLTIAFYLLVEKEKLLHQTNNIVDVFLPTKFAKNFKAFCSDSNKIFSGYIRGQIADALIITVLTGTAFTIIGVPYPFVVGAVSGFSNLIPYVGACVAFVLSISLSLIGGTPMTALYSAIAVLVIQQIDSIFIVPKIVGESVSLHPILVILALSVFGSLYGLFGMIIAVPVTAIIKNLIVNAYESKKAENAN